VTLRKAFLHVIGVACLGLQETEKYLADMVTTKALVAKVDRPAGIINFQARKDSHEVLNTWAVSIEKLLELVEKSCHQIHKESMLHKVPLSVS
jgi:26S proteasome regulatory subunit N5